MKKALFFIVSIAGFLAALYIGLWIYSAQWFTKEINHLYSRAQEDGIEFLGPKPAMTNFPFVPEVYYNGGVRTGNLAILFPEAKLKGYPVPFTTLHLSFPKGVALDGPVNPAIWSLDMLEAELVIPTHLPRSFEYEDLQLWQQAGGQIDIRHYRMTKHTLASEGMGFVSLDSALQPIIEFKSDVRGYETFIRHQTEQQLIEPFPAAIAATVLNGLAKTDEASGEKTVTVNVSVRNRLLSVGPLQALPLPEIVWDRRTPPAPHQ